MLRRIAALGLAATLALLAACGIASLPTDPDNEKLESALTTFVDTLGRGEYAAALGLMCPEGAEGTSEEELRTEFEAHPRPWKKFVTATGRSGDTGYANLDLTPEGRSVVRYTFDVVRLADGSWQVCDVSRGSVQVDVD